MTDTLDAMDTTFKTRFQGRLIECKTLTSGQVTVASLLGSSMTEESVRRGLHRVFRIIESRVGPEEWGRIDDGMAMGTVSETELLALFTKMLEATAKVDPDAEAE